MRRLFGVIALLLLPLVSWAEAPEQPITEANYVSLPQAVRTADPTRIEVVEVFWYGCIHCFKLDPLLKDWLKTLPKDVDFHRSPAMWNTDMAIHAQAFYAAQALGVLEKVHEPLFLALSVQHKPLANVDLLADFFAQFGVKDADFRKAFTSFVVQSNVKQADARARSYRITGTPELVVNGKYTVSARNAGGQENMLRVVEYLIAKERAELKAAAH